ncbi:MAG: Unknown protein [uncultured Thiotrichaceae bacterium]|uniref:Ammonium transporter AmtB-like domain-containing protein n=1 Tax=uncultured Thiotrichaceae bacterium TaxID=298394 RepID=A0A6S6SB86_9GAMM|nr:MAG: Unknown protein [uncultured Thiotrichaceae bacterium]
MISIRTFLKKLVLLLFLIFQLSMYGNSSLLVYAAEPQGQESADAEQPGGSTEESDVTGQDSPTGTDIINTTENIDFIQQTLQSLRLEIENSKESTNLNKGQVQAMKDGLDLIEDKLKDAYAALDQSRTGISGNAEKLKELEKLFLTGSRDVRTNSADLASQKSLIEDNSVRLYELLIQLDTIDTEIKKFTRAIQESDDQKPEEDGVTLAVNSDLKKIWMIMATALVFLAPLAFSFPLTDNKSVNDTSTQQSVVLACLFAIFGYLLLGFSLMYGTTSSGWIGLGSYLFPGYSAETEGLEPAFSLIQFMPFQAGFIVLAALVIGTALGRQISALSQAGVAFFTGTLLIPVFGHWAWASRFTPGNKGWLEGAGFVDQAGAAVVSVVAACFALVVLYKLSRRSPSEQKPDGILQSVYSAPAILFLWLSWLGFISGMLPFSDERIPVVILNALIAAAVSGVIAFLPHAFFNQEKIAVARGLAGFVSGLVAISACGQSVTFIEAAIVGLGAGILQNLLFNFLRKLFLPHDHQIRAAYLITIHGVAGVWGILCVALLGTEGNLSPPNFIQLFTQFQGIAAAIVYSIVMAYIATFLLTFRKKRVKKADEPAA